MMSHRIMLSAMLGTLLGLDGVAIGQERAPIGEAAPIQVGGTLVINVSLVTALPNGATVTVSPFVQPVDKVYGDTSSTSGTGTVSGGKAKISLKIPYSWRVSSRNDKVTISVSVFSFLQQASFSYNDLTSFSSTIALPANGKTTVVGFSGTL